VHLLCFVCNNLSFWFLVLQIHPSAHEVSLNLCMAVCCMVVGAVFLVFFLSWAQIWLMPYMCNERSNCPGLIFRNRGPERTSNCIEDSANKGNHAYPCMAQKMVAISTMDHN